ncbi:biotin transporter BioY [Paenibacillus puerhi]|uniref:biotin transporter BioY n=1 Tax=Paenibacillus puerhi TaxID=2692622 RepID=UPI00135CBCBF|nr:ECF transporter S component [Paenibacillus puerhi]
MKLSLRGIVFTALFSALLVLFGYISIPLGFTPVPISLQTLAVMLAGALLGPLYGFLSVALVIVLTAIGFPLFHGVGGFGILLGSTGGYILMWPFSALLIGLLIPRIRLKGFVGYASAYAVLLVFGSWLVYVSAVPWLAHVKAMSLSAAMVAGCYPFLLGDAIKAAAALLILIPVRQAFPAERLTGGAGNKVVPLD